MLPIKFSVSSGFDQQIFCKNKIAAEILKRRMALAILRAEGDDVKSASGDTRASERNRAGQNEAEN